MKSHVGDQAFRRRRFKLMADALGLDASQIKEVDGITADWMGGDQEVVVTWTGIKVLSLEEWTALLRELSEREANDRTDQWAGPGQDLASGTEGGQRATDHPR